MRDAYHDQLESIVQELVDMTDTVRSSVRESTSALLSADTAAAEAVISGDHVIDERREQVEERALLLLATQQPVASDLRMLVASLRMVGELERMGDLSVHVAKIARMRMPAVAVPADVRPTVARMGEVAERMVDAAAKVLLERDVDGARRLEAEDDEMDRLRASMLRQLLSDDWEHGVEPAVDVALLTRYYERIGDHAVSLARRVVYLVTGEQPVSAPGS